MIENWTEWSEYCTNMLISSSPNLTYMCHAIRHIKGHTIMNSLIYIGGKQSGFFSLTERIIILWGRTGDYY